MKLRIPVKLIDEAEYPEGLLYRLIIIYVLCAVFFTFFMAFLVGEASHIDFYFIVNLCTTLILTWVIRRSFHMLSQQRMMASFRIGLFFLLNSTLTSMAGGLDVVDKETASIIAAILYVPAILLIIHSFNQFIRYFNDTYSSAVDLSLTDELTGLPNRRHVNIRLREIENKNALICIVDIDHFKNINDTFGHEAGDTVLRYVSLVLKKFVYDEVFISRSGGEEFLIIITDMSNSRSLIRDIHLSISNHCNDPTHVTVSIGVAQKLRGESTSLALIAADEALYKAKKAGRNCIMYASEQCSSSD